jgi:probable HAF family extracellular repeat protein
MTVRTVTSGLLAVMAAVVLVALAAIPASGDPPPAAAGTTSHGFLAARGALRTIDHPDAATVPGTPDGQTGTGALGINDRGEILGVYEGRDRVVRHFVRDRGGRYSIIADPPGRNGDGLTYEAVDINNRGEIVGFYNDDDGVTTTGFLRDRRGRFRDINVPGSRVTGPLRINDRRQVVGIYSDGDGAVHGFLWDDGEFATIDVPGAAATVVLGINDRGQMVGSYIDAGGAYHGFVRGRDGDVTRLPEAPGADPASGGTQPASVNERGQIVGVGYDSRGGSRGFLFERGRFTLLDGTGDATYTRALDISNRGQIVGDYGTRPPVRESSAGARRRDRGLRPGGRAWLP